MTKNPYEDKFFNAEKNRNVARREAQDAILEMMAHYHSPSTEEILWKDLFDESKDARTLSNTYANV